jgi:hypothetical protein
LNAKGVDEAKRETAQAQLAGWEQTAAAEREENDRHTTEWRQMLTPLKAPVKAKKRPRGEAKCKALGEKEQKQQQQIAADPAAAAADKRRLNNEASVRYRKNKKMKIAAAAAAAAADAAADAAAADDQ